MNFEVSVEQEHKYERLIKQAVAGLEKTAYGKFLLERFPLHLTTATSYARENSVLLQTGSPACTDGIDVFVSAHTTAAFFENIPFKQWKTDWSKSGEQLWTMETTDEDAELNDKQKVSEIQDIILHEYTHAINKHPKLQRAAAKKSDKYQQRLSVACEIQANDGLMGHRYATNYSQQPKGVTNKRMHPETLGAHTLTEILRALKDNEQDGQGSSAQQSSAASQKMMETTGAGEKWDREIQNEAKREAAEKAGKEGDDKDGDKSKDGERIGGDSFEHEEGGQAGDSFNKTADEILDKQLAAQALKGIKNLILSALSKQLSYDAETDTVVYNQVKHRETTRTYSRPSKRQNATSGGYEFIKKGIRRKRVIEYEESNDLLVLAVDASGSMHCQERYVSAILDDLVKQVDAICKEQNVDVHWENLLAGLHDDQCRYLVSVKSESWKNTMAHYHAMGGNDFDSVLRQIKNQLLDDEHRSYNSITVLNLSDGLDVLDSEWEGTTLGDYISDGKVRWVDAIIGSNRTVQEAARAMSYDHHKIREQLVLALN